MPSFYKQILLFFRDIRVLNQDVEQDMILFNNKEILIDGKTVCIGNHMISSAIWDKSARVNFSKANQIARARRASAICGL